MIMTASTFNLYFILFLGLILLKVKYLFWSFKFDKNTEWFIKVLKDLLEFLKKETTYLNLKSLN